MDDDPPVVDQQIVAKATPHLQLAVEHLLKAWDSVYEAEKIFGFDITTMELSDLAAGIDEARDVRRDLTQTIILEWANEVRTSAK